MKKFTILLAIFMLVACLMSFGCSTGGNGGKKSGDGSGGEQNIVKDVAEVTKQGNDYVMAIEGYSLQFKSAEGYSLNVQNTTGGTAKNTYKAESPVRVYVFNSSSNECLVYNLKYTSITHDDETLTAVCDFTTDGGSQYTVTDVYEAGIRSFAFERTVRVNSANANEVGFASEFSVYGNEMGDMSLSNFDRFVPALLYKDNVGIRAGQLFYSTSIAEQFVRETFCALPSVMAYNKSSGNAITIQHLKPEISAPYNGGQSATYQISADYRYGSIGYYYGEEFGLGFRYPVRQTPTTLNLYTPAQNGTEHTYSINIIPDRQTTYNDAMVYSYKKAFANEDPSVPAMNIETVYQQNIDIFDNYYEEYSYSGSKVGGIPFYITLPSGTPTSSDKDGYGAFAGGFVGQQLPIAYQLLQYGYDHNNDSFIERGTTMMDFWTSSRVMNAHTVPAIWWDAKSNNTLGTERNINKYLRYLTDIPEGMLDAYICAEAHGEEYEQWFSAVIKYANLFCTLQMSDGSWYRCYDSNGSVCKQAADSDPYGDSKTNTYMPVRFLGKVYELTDNESYKEAALKAAKYVYDNCYMEDNKYYGGTADNPNIIDKEAAVYAMYCFNAAYELADDAKAKEKYYKAAEHAAVCAMSWTYVYDFKVPNQSETSTDVASNPFVNGGVKGFSVIGTGVTAADNYNNYIYYELYKMFLKRNFDPFYKTSALILQNASKYCSDFDGRLGYGMPGFMPEATSIANFRFASVSTWLPWSGIANIEPMINMKKVFGQMDILKITDDNETQLKKVNKYGIGGNLLSA